MKLEDVCEMWQRKKFVDGDYDLDDALDILVGSERLLMSMNVIEISLLSIANSLRQIRTYEGLEYEEKYSNTHPMEG